MATEVFTLNVDVIILSSIFAYNVVLGALAQKGVCQFDHLGSQAKIAYSGLITCWAYLALSFVTDLIIFLELNAGIGVDRSFGLLATLLFKLISVCLMISLAMQRTGYLDWIYTLGTNKEASAIDPAEREVLESIILRFEAELATPEFYNEPSPSLSAMAGKLDVPARELSKAINTMLGESYSKHINCRRVNRAKNLLAERPNMPVTEIMYESGFQTKSSFNKEFRAIEGMSPTEYRKQAAG